MMEKMHLAIVLLHKLARLLQYGVGTVVQVDLVWVHRVAVILLQVCWQVLCVRVAAMQI